MDQRLPSALDHLQEALSIASGLGVAPDAEAEERAQAVLQRISELEPTKTTVISSTLSQAGFFDELVRQQVSRAGVAAEHLVFADALETILSLLGPPDAGDRGPDSGVAWPAVTSAFADLQSAYEPIGGVTLEEIEREQMAIEAYREFRLAVKEAETIGLELLETAFARYNTARQKVQEEDLEGADGERVTLLDRVRQLQDEERRWGVARDVANRLVAAAAGADIVMGRLTQSAAGKERLYWQSQAFIGSVGTVIEALPKAADGRVASEEATEIIGNLRTAIELFRERTRETAEEVEGLAAEAEDELSELVADSEERLQRLTPSRS